MRPTGPQFKPLMNATAKNFTVREVSADAAYCSYENMNVGRSRGRNAVHRVQVQHDREAGWDVAEDVPLLQPEARRVS